LFINETFKENSGQGGKVCLSSRRWFYIVGESVVDLTFPSKRRSSLIISVAILKAAKKGTRQIHLLSSVSLSYGQFTRYIEFLKAHGFIEEKGYIYQTTDEGLRLIEEFDSSSLIQSFLVT